MENVKLKQRVSTDLDLDRHELEACILFHTDRKPRNVMVQPNPSGLDVETIDWSLSCYLPVWVAVRNLAHACISRFTKMEHSEIKQLNEHGFQSMRQYSPHLGRPDLRLASMIRTFIQVLRDELFDPQY